MEYCVRKFVIVVSRLRQLHFMSMYDCGYLVIPAASIAEAVRSVRDCYPIDVLLLAMHDVAAEEEFKELRERFPKLKVGIFLPHDRLSEACEWADFVLDAEAGEAEIAQQLDRISRFRKAR